MVAYHFPPMNVSSGIQRTLRFAQYLPEFNWDPIVLTVQPQAYPSISDRSLGELPPKLKLRRAFALDAARHLSFRGRYPRFLGIPDRWWSWWLCAVPAGLALIRKHKPDVLWSTYPIATAHLIGYTLHRITGIPWVADFRDPMAQEGYPSDPLEHRVFEWIEYHTLKHCTRAIFTARGALRLYAERYPEIPESRLTLIENGFDESTFAGAEHTPLSARSSDGSLLLVHSGTIYPRARDPRHFFDALSQLKKNGVLKSGALKIILRATGCDPYLRTLIGAHGLHDVVMLEPAVPYREALAEMLSADGLVLLQAANCNYQVPAKLYEYLRAGRPVLALTDPAGDTAQVLRDAGIDTIANLDSSAETSRLLIRFLDLLRKQTAPTAKEEKIYAASRKSRTLELAHVFDATVS
jgi:glycosyltransferase involved in cell wall biosynthesis